MPVVLSNEITGMLTPGPAAPVLMSVEGDGQTAKCKVTLPTTDSDGQPLSDMKTLMVFYKTTSMVGSNATAEIAAGTPMIAVPVTKEQAGQVIEVDIPNLAYRTEYFFDAAVV